MMNSNGMMIKQPQMQIERDAETAKAYIQIAMIKLMSRRLARFVNF
jgi:hypothetical protein